MASVRETIMVAMQAVLEGLSLGSDANGVEDVIERVEREYTAAETYPELPVAFILDNRQRNRTGADGAKLGTYDNVVFIRLLIVARAGRKTRDEPLSTTGNRIVEFIGRAIGAEGVPAIGTIKILPGVIWVHIDGDDRVPFGDGPKLILQAIDVSVRFRHSAVDPAIPRG